MDEIKHYNTLGDLLRAELAGVKVEKVMVNFHDDTTTHSELPQVPVAENYPPESWKHAKENGLPPPGSRNARRLDKKKRR